jgi:hypothetical protein
MEECGAVETADLKFTFTPRWKEELVCSCAEGEFLLDMTMGITAVYLTPEEDWERVAPEWAKGCWKTLHAQLAAWCKECGYPLRIE